MAAQTITMYQGDTLPALPRQLTDQNGNIINLTGCTVVHKTQQGTTVLMETRLGEPSSEAPQPALTAVP